MTGRVFITGLAERGQYFFTTEDAAKAFNSSPASTKARLRLLRSQGAIATPYRGFHVIVAPEYRSIGCLPPEQFVPALMKHLGAPYYVGLLSAAELHGAAHQKPQVFQVITDKARPRIVCGKVVVRFFQRKQIQLVPTAPIDTPRGPASVSSPEATAIDLVAFARNCGGLDHVATVLMDIHEKIKGKNLAEQALRIAETPWLQRLGYLLEKIGASKTTGPLAALIARLSPRYVPLQPGASIDRAYRDTRWRLLINTEVEPDQ